MFGSIANFFSKLSFPGFKRSATLLQPTEEELKERLIQPRDLTQQSLSTHCHDLGKKSIRRELAGVCFRANLKEEKK
jgi:hypothetical protein